MMKMTFPAKDEFLQDVLGFVEETLESYECPMKTQVAVCVAIEEIFVNIAHYAYGDGEGDVLDFKVQPEAVQKAILWIAGSDFSEVLNNVCDSPFAIGVVDVNETDKWARNYVLERI